MAAIVIVGVIAAFVGSLFSGKKSMQQENAAWADAARAHSLIVTPGSGLGGLPSISGQVRGVAVHVKGHMRGSGDSRQRYTRYTISFPSVGPAVTMKRQGFGASIGKLFGRTVDVQIGSVGFDNAVVIDTNNQPAVRAFLSPARQSVVLALFERFQFVTVTNTSIEADTRGRVSSAHEMTSTIRQLVDMALIIGAPTDVDVALTKQADGMLGEAVAELHAINETFAANDQPNSFAQLLEAEAAVAHGDPSAAIEALDSIDLEAGSSPDVEEWRDVAASHLLPPMPPAQAMNTGATLPPLPPLGAETPPIEEGPDQDWVITDLLQSDRTGAEAEAHFLDHYSNRVVRWSGVVDSERPFRYDSDFDGEGLRAVITIGSLGDGVLITNRVQAVVHLPTGTELRRGDDITIEGSLLRFDRYMRNFYIADGYLVA